VNLKTADRFYTKATKATKQRAYGSFFVSLVNFCKATAVFAWVNGLVRVSSPGAALGTWLRPPRFSKYRPAPRLGTRQVERRVWQRIHWQIASARH
jgi:hypothetical protein